MNKDKLETIREKFFKECVADKITNVDGLIFEETVVTPNPVKLWHWIETNLLQGEAMGEAKEFAVGFANYLYEEGWKPGLSHGWDKQFDENGYKGIRTAWPALLVKDYVRKLTQSSPPASSGNDIEPYREMLAECILQMKVALPDLEKCGSMVSASFFKQIIGSKHTQSLLNDVLASEADSSNTASPQINDSSIEA